MKFIDTEIPGVYIVEPDLYSDERGFFTRTWSEREFRERGCGAEIVECNVSFNRRQGTLRGLHFQLAPHEQPKLVRCTSGAMWDVAVDIRPQSPAFRRHVGVELTARNHRQLFIPAGCAHGFQTLEEDTEVFYQMGGQHNPASARGYRWNDPAFGISWPRPVTVILERDNTYPDFTGTVA